MMNNISFISADYYNATTYLISDILFVFNLFNHVMCTDHQWRKYYSVVSLKAKQLTFFMVAFSSTGLSNIYYNHLI